METSIPPNDSVEIILNNHCNTQRKELNLLIQKLKDIKLGEDIVKESRNEMMSALETIKETDYTISATIQKLKSIRASEYVKYKLGKQVIQALSKKREVIESFLPIFARANDYIQKHPQIDFNREKPLVDEYFKIQQDLIKAIDFYIDSVSKLEVSAEEEEKELGVKDIDLFLKDAELDTAQIQELQKEAQEIFEKKGALCDSEGFYQHMGECWSDALQQVMLNTDGLKEPVQKYFIFETIPLSMEQVETSIFLPPMFLSLYRSMAEKFYKSMFIKFNEKKKWLGIYLREVQKRFLRHYISEGKRRKLEDEVCALNQPAKIARDQILAISKDTSARMSGKQGITAAILAKFGDLSSKAAKEKITGLPSNDLFRSSTVSLEEYKKDGYAGGSDDDIAALLNLFQFTILPNNLRYQLIFSKYRLNTIIEAYSKILLVPPNLTSQESFYKSLVSNPEETINSISSMIVSVAAFKNNQKEDKGHEVAFYLCGGKQFFYEDNYGSYPFPWKDLLKKFAETKEDIGTIHYIIFEVVSDDDFFIQRYYPAIFFKSNNSYGTFVENEYVEFSTPSYTKEVGKKKYRLRKQKENTYIATSTIFLIYSLEKTDISNLGYVFQPQARIKQEMDELQKIINAIQENDIEYIDKVLSDNDAVEKIKSLESEKNNSCILHAASQQSVPIVQKLLTAGFDPNKDQNKYTALHSAAFNQNDELIKILLQAGANVNAVDPETGTPLHRFFSGENQSLSTLELLVNAGGDINQPDKDDYTPFSRAVQGSTLPIVQYLFEKGGDIQRKSKNGDSLLMSTIFNKKNGLEILKFLVEKGLDLNSEKLLPFFAIILNNLNILKYVVESGIDVNSKSGNGKTLLFVASEEGNVDIIQYLCSKGADPDIVVPADPEKGTPNRTAIDVAKNNTTKMFVSACKFIKNTPKAKKGFFSFGKTTRRRR